MDIERVLIILSLKVSVGLYKFIFIMINVSYLVFIYLDRLGEKIFYFGRYRFIYICMYFYLNSLKLNWKFGVNNDLNV